MAVKHEFLFVFSHAHVSKNKLYLYRQNHFPVIMTPERLRILYFTGPKNINPFYLCLWKERYLLRVVPTGTHFRGLKLCSGTEVIDLQIRYFLEWGQSLPLKHSPKLFFRTLQIKSNFTPIYCAMIELMMLIN